MLAGDLGRGLDQRVGVAAASGIRVDEEVVEEDDLLAAKTRPLPVVVGEADDRALVVHCDEQIGLGLGRIDHLVQDVLDVGLVRVALVELAVAAKERQERRNVVVGRFANLHAGVLPVESAAQDVAERFLVGDGEAP